MQKIGGLDQLNRLVLPDGWQAEAIGALKAGSDVIVDAPTGAGKTYVFEKYLESQAAKIEAVYTVPTRALANDKYAEWKQRGWRVGIATGDVSIDPDAPVLVATLEAVQDIAARRPGVNCFVVDEYQWLSDPVRGNHYEGVLMRLPSHVQLLLLSGSVRNTSEIAAWLRRLGRDVRVVSHLQRPVPLEEVNLDDLARSVNRRVEGFWQRRVLAALQENLGPILIFVPHRREAEKMARVLARDLPPPLKPVTLTPEQTVLAGPDLAKLVQAGVAYHHSGLNYEQRSRIVEPLAKEGRLRIVVATLGLSAGVNFSLRSVLITAKHYKVEGFETDILPHELLQMIGRAGRRGLDEIGYYLHTSASPSMLEARAMNCRRAGPLPLSALLRGTRPGESLAERAEQFASALFTEATIPVGIEQTLRVGAQNLPCRQATDTGRARLVRRRQRKFAGCRTCAHKPECLSFSAEPRLMWQLLRTGVVDRELRLTERGWVVSRFMGAEGFALAAALESKDYPPGEVLFDLANLFGGERFCGSEPRWAGRLAIECRRVYGEFTIDGYLLHGVPPQYGYGAREMLERLFDGTRKARLVQEHAGVGDIDRLLIEWRSLLRQIVHAEIDLPRWQPLRAEAVTLLQKLG